jgi:hypothetical protein
MARLQVGQKSWLASKPSKSFCRCGGIIGCVRGLAQLSCLVIFFIASATIFSSLSHPPMRLNIAVSAGKCEFAGFGVLAQH